MNLYGSDAEFARDLEQLGTLADRVARLDVDLRQDLSPAAAAYLERRAEVASRYGLNLLPNVEVDHDPWGFPLKQPSGEDFLHGWCFKRRGRRPLTPEKLGEAAGFSGEVPTVRVSVQTEWEPTRESRQRFRRRVAKLLTSQIETGLAQPRQAGYAFGRQPSKRDNVHLRWLFERMRFRGKLGQYAQISSRANARGELSASLDDEPDQAKSEVVKAVTVLADSIGITIRTRRVD